MAEHIAHVQPWKKDMVKTIIKDLPNYKTVAIINLENLPSRQSQVIRSKIKEHAKIIITRKRLIKLALDKCGKADLKQISEHIQGMPALILTNKNAFELFKILKDNMTDAPAKTGQIAPDDIWVKAGPTPFAPGPIIGDLGAANIVAGIDGGKVVVKKDSLVVKAGEPVPAAAAAILSRLDIKPMKIGLNLVIAVEEGKLFERNILNIDVDEYTNNLKQAILNAKKLALGANILTPETVTIKLQEAHIDAKKLAFGADILCDETKEHLLKKAEAQAATLKEKIPEVPVEEKKVAEPAKEDQVEEVKESKSSEEESTPKEETPEEIKDDNQGGQ
jgi:large subunit ribosomal protein L10